MTGNLPAELGVSHPDIPFPVKLSDDGSKVIRTDTGEVAVLVSPGFGAGFYTWNTYGQLTPFCPPAVLAVLLGKHELITEDSLAEYYGVKDDEYCHFYCGGAGDLIVLWLTPGTAFSYSEYNGSESLRTLDDLTWRA